MTNIIQQGLLQKIQKDLKNIVLGALKAEKDIVKKYKDIIDVDKIKYNNGKGTIYSEIAKQISLYGSVRLIDASSEEDIYNFVYNKLEEMINAKIKESKIQKIFVIRLKKITINVINQQRQNFLRG